MKTQHADRNLEMAKHPERWPCWPFLPVKHKNRRDNTGFPELGVIADNTRPEVFLTNLWIGISEDTKSEVYPSFEALFADGWIVD